MELRIKDLRRIETEIDKELSRKSSTIGNASRYSYEEFKTLDEAASNTLEDLTKNLEMVFKLQDIKFNIREIVGKFNEDTGINSKALKIAQLKAKLDIITRASQESTPRKQTSYSAGKSYFTAGISTDSIEEFNAESRRILRQIQALKDSCAGTNANGKVVISEEMQDTLRKLGMID